MSVESELAVRTPRLSLEQVLITGELEKRTGRAPDHAAEASALHAVAAAMTESPTAALEALVREALRLCVPNGNGTTGVSLVDTDPETGERLFRWTALAGVLAANVGGTTPIDDSPCGVCVAQRRPVLLSHPELYFTYFLAAGVPFVEALVVPFRVAGELAGTIWVIAHDDSHPLDAEDVRMMTSLADFTGTAYELIRAREQAGRMYALSSALASATTPEDVATALVEHGAGVFGATGIVLVCQQDDPAQLEIVRVAGMPGEIEHAWHFIPVDARIPIAEVWRTGEAIFLPSRDAWSARFPGFEGVLAVAGHHANAILPLDVGERRLGVVGIAFDAPRAFTEHDRLLARSLATLTAQALDRTRLFEAAQVARLQAEEAQRVAESASRAKSDFLAIMSHELRTPLNAIGGYVELMEMGIRGPVTVEQREDLRRMQQSQRHLLGLINGVLNYAKLETGSVQFDTSAVPLREVLATAEALVAPQAREHGLALSTGDCPDDLAASADPEKLRQIIVNLLSNAVKFTGRGGQIDVVCRDEGSLCITTVSDTGIGIPRDKLESIFDPFVQVDGRLTRTKEGTGLGLAISRDLARGMGGDLTAQSTVGVGSTFTLVLPRA